MSPSSFPAKIPLVVSVLYFALVMAAAWFDRQPSNSAGWITLSGLRTWLATFPVSILAELLGARPSYRDSFAQVLAAAIPCALLVYALTHWLTGLCRALLAR